MVIRFRLENPREGEWIIKVKSTVVVEGSYHIWIPKTGMILPGTVLSPADPFTTIYNTSAAPGSIAIGCYDRKSQSASATSLIYENQLIKGEELANSNVMRAILANYVKRELTISYPNPSLGYGVLDIKMD